MMTLDRETLLHIKERRRYGGVRCMSPLLALSGHHADRAECPLLGEKRTQVGHR
jgi:hypothetical protein